MLVGGAAGLFLHVGFSVKDRHVIQANTPVAFRADSVADKLGTLLNEDSAEQVCHLANDNAQCQKYNETDRRLAGLHLDLDLRGHIKPRLHDTTGCQTGCTTGLTTGCIV